ncbi:MAG: hypothetical protein DMF27_03375 [Verrucomicrobia bacterium]|nr:MAG: hypothetical protein DMF27_03375 [Verrucomicrobiota bacterium]PYM07762.1 MAG: hypothetical protein DMF15_09875 [Verrucomicrobiota bacterium]
MRRLVCLSVTIATLLTISNTGRAQTFAPPKLSFAGREQATKKDPIQVITRETPEVLPRETPAQVITKEKPVVAEKQMPEVITKPVAPVVKNQVAEVITKPIPQVATKERTFEPVRPIAKEKPPVTTKQMPEVITKPIPQVATKGKTFEPVRPIPHYNFKTPDGRQESVPVITHYYPNQIVHPLGTTDRHLDPKLTRAATIAQERAHAHSRSMCWHYVKEALLASGVIDSRPKSEFARDAAQDLVSNYGFKKLLVRDPFAAPIGSVLVYGTSRSVGHVEIRTKDGFVSDFRSPTPSHRPLIGVYAKL